MNIKLFPCLVLLFFSVSLFGCKGDTGPAGPSLTGSMTGFVTLVQSDGTRPADLSGVTVSIDGTSQSTVTDSAGKWTLSGLNTGFYSLTFSKAGYGTYRIEDDQFVGGGTLYLGKSTLAKPPYFTVALDTVKSLTDSNSVYVTGSVSGLQKTASSSPYLLIAVGTEPEVSAADANKYLYSTTYYLSSITSFSVHLYHSALNLAGFQTSETAYVVVYPLSINGLSSYTSYTDHSTGRSVITSLGAPSAVLKVTIP